MIIFIIAGHVLKKCEIWRQQAKVIIGPKRALRQTRGAARKKQARGGNHSQSEWPQQPQTEEPQLQAASARRWTSPTASQPGNLWAALRERTCLTSDFVLAAAAASAATASAAATAATSSGSQTISLGLLPGTQLGVVVYGPPRTRPLDASLGMPAAIYAKLPPEASGGLAR